MAVEASLKVAEGDTSRPLDVDDFKTPATGAATESSLEALKTANHTDLAAVAAAVALLATDAHFQAFMAANHTDLVEVLTALQGTLLVESKPISMLVTARSAGGRITAYTLTYRDGSTEDRVIDRDPSTDRLVEDRLA